jgi:hypothetical protein
MRNTERGITFIGLVILVVFIGTFVYAGIRLTPVYLEYFEVVKAFDGIKAEASGAVSPQSIRVQLQKRFDVDDVKSLDARDVEITRDGGVWTIHASWTAETPFVANISFLLHFDKVVTLAST